MAATSTISALTAALSGDLSDDTVLPIDDDTGVTRSATFRQVRSGLARVFNPVDYGAVGDSVTSDRAAFQSAIDAAIAVNGLVYVPEPPGGYNSAYIIDAPLYLRPATGSTQTRLRMSGRGNYIAITYTGATGTSVFQCEGLKQCVFEDVQVQLQNPHNVTVWDLRCVPGATSTSHCTWINCHALLGTGGANIGWRAIPGLAGIGDFASMLWVSCSVTGLGRTLGDIGWQSGTSNAIPWTWINCGASSCRYLMVDGALATRVGAAGATSGVTTIPADSTVGFPNTGTLLIQSEQVTYTGRTSTTFTGCTRAANGTSAASHAATIVITQILAATAGSVPVGSGDKFFYGGGGSGNDIEFLLTAGASYLISGARFEDDNTLVQCGVGASGGLQELTLDSVTVSGVCGPIVVDARCPLSLQVRNPNWINFAPAGLWGADMLTLAGGSPSWAALSVRGGSISATDPFYTLPNPTNAGNAAVDIWGVLRLDATFVAAGHFTPIRKDTIAETWAAAAPIAGAWKRGDVTWNTTPSSGGPPGWVCTTAGTPGTWKAMANLA